MSYKVSVIIPVYNVEFFFEQCLRSLFEQTLDSIEYIFINDCTPDNSMALLDKILEEYPKRKKQVRIINHKQNMGLGAARKDGMIAASGEYVISCDSDDWVDVEMYEKMYYKAIEEDADIVCCGFYNEYVNKSVKITYPQTEENDRESMKRLRWNILYSSVCNKLIKRDLYVYNNIYPFDGINKWEDLIVTIRLRYFSKKTIIMNEAFYHYYRLNENSITAQSNLYKVEEQIRCAQYIEDFFLKQNSYEEFFILIQYIKFISKSQLVTDKHIRNIKQWKKIYPETHEDIWHYKNMSIKSRLIFWIISKKF